VGLGLFGSHDLFPGRNLQGPRSPDGLQYGITSAGDDPLTGNAAVTGRNALISNSVLFTLTGLPLDYDLDVSNVSFHYGTDPCGPNDPGFPVSVPEPASLFLLGAGLLALCTARRWIGR
jgi:hypothetical protein